MGDRIQDLRSKTGWAMFDTGILDLGLNAYAIAVYIALLRFTNNQTDQAFPGIPTLGKMISVSPNTVRKALADLAAVEAISVEPRADDVGRQTSNLYTLHPLKPLHHMRGSPSPHEGSGVHQMKGDPSPDEGELEEVELNESELGKDSAPDGADAPKAVSKRTKKPAAPKPAPDPAVAARSAAIVKLIEAWLKASGALAKNPYANTGNRDYAGALHDAGVSPMDVIDHIDHLKRFDKFWSDKSPGLKYVAQNYKTWRARHPQYHAAGTVPAAQTKPVAPESPLMGSNAPTGVPDEIKKILEDNKKRYGGRP